MAVATIDMTESPSLLIGYDERFDTLEIVFRIEPALTIEIQDDVYAHVVPATRQVVGLTIHHFRDCHAQIAIPFSGTLVPINPQVAAEIADALRPS